MESRYECEEASRHIIVRIQGTNPRGSSKSVPSSSNPSSTQWERQISLKLSFSVLLPTWIFSDFLVRHRKPQPYTLSRL